MSQSGGNSSAQNGTGSDPFQRLSSFKTPRDLSLGGVKPNKKIFTPNLSVTRNKNKGPSSTHHDSKDVSGWRDRKNDKNKNIRNGPKIIKSSGVFSEGMGTLEPRSSSRVSYGRDSTTAVLEKPTIRVKEAWKIDKELEEKKIKTLNDDNMETEEESYPEPLTADAPVRLPLLDTGNLLRKPKVKHEVTVKQEPNDDVDSTMEHRKSLIDNKETYDEGDIVGLLKCDKPKLILLQLPDTLPGRRRVSEPARTKSSNTTTAPTENTDTDQSDNRCCLKDLEEGRIGRLLIHRSGKVRMALGDTMFEIHPGTKSSFRQEAVSVACDDNTRSANIIALGPLHQKIDLIPDWEAMFKDVAL